MKILSLAFGILLMAPTAFSEVGLRCGYGDQVEAFSTAGPTQSRDVLLKVAEKTCLERSKTPEKCAFIACFEDEVPAVWHQRLAAPVVQHRARQAQQNTPGEYWAPGTTESEKNAVRGVWAERERERQDKLDQLIKDYDNHH